MSSRIDTFPARCRMDDGAVIGAPEAWTTFVIGDACWSIPSRDVVCHGALGEGAAVVAIEREALRFAMADRRVMPIVDPRSHAWATSAPRVGRGFLVVAAHGRRVAILADAVRAGLYVTPSVPLDLERIARVRTLTEGTHGLVLVTRPRRRDVAPWPPCSNP